MYIRHDSRAIVSFSQFRHKNNCFFGGNRILNQASEKEFSFNSADRVVINCFICFTKHASASP
jgi:hypothetical protein